MLELLELVVLLRANRTQIVENKKEGEVESIIFLVHTGLLHRPYITPALYYTGPLLHWPFITLALYYTGPVLHQPYITPAL